MMKSNILLAVLGLWCGILRAEDTNSVTVPAIPEEARKHFVMGGTMFKEANGADDFSLAAKQFIQAAELAPQWPEARYNLALAEEAAGDYTGALADLKRYQAFKLTDTEARTVQDKIYAVEAKQQMKLTEAARKSAEEKSPEALFLKFCQSLDGGEWRSSGGTVSWSDGRPYEPAGGTLASSDSYIVVHGNEIIRCETYANPSTVWKTNLSSQQFDVNLQGDPQAHKVTISQDGKSISEKYNQNYPFGVLTKTAIYKRNN